MRKAMYLMGVLDDADMEWLASHGVGLHAPKGTTLVHEGQPLNSLFLLLDGELSITTGSLHIASLLAGEVVGEISFVDSRPPLATVTATQDSRLLAIANDRLLRKMDMDKKFAANFYRAIATFLADRLRTTTVRLGYGALQDQAAREADDLGDDLLETVSQGTRRFDDLLKRMFR